ncbi:MAG: OmpH family outer membrane protein [Balneolaceae bacterium]
MLKKGFLTILLSTVPLLLIGQQLKVGIMDPDRVMMSLPETEQIQQELQEYNQQMEEMFTAEYSEWMDAVNEFEAAVEAGTISEAEQEAEEARLLEQEEELQNLQQRIQRQIQNRQNELIGPIMQRVEEALELVAAEMNLDYVLNTQTSTGDPLVYYASERAVDITNRVISVLTSNQD